MIMIMFDIWSSLEWGSSTIDWCEKNFNVLNYVAEFYNTISNILFLTVPPLHIYLFRQYSRKMSIGPNVVFILLLVVGMGSTYFHITLSLLGQLIDEIAILWVLMASTAFWLPVRRMPSVFNQDRELFQRAIIPISVISTGLCCILPQINAFVLMLFAVPIITLLVEEYKKSRSARVRSLAMRSCIIGVIAVVLWVNDRLLCEIFWYQFPYLHAFWHILVFTSTSPACVLFAYFTALNERPELEPVLRYWPKEGGIWEFIGIPYVTFRSDTKSADYQVLNQERIFV